MKPGTWWFRIGEATFEYRDELFAKERRQTYINKPDRLYKVSAIQHEPAPNEEEFS